MKKERKHLLNKKGEGYIDTVVLVLCAMLVIALAVRVYPVYIVKLQLDNFADELVTVSYTHLTLPTTSRV